MGRKLPFNFFWFIEFLFLSKQERNWKFHHDQLEGSEKVTILGTAILSDTRISTKKYQKVLIKIFLKRGLWSRRNEVKVWAENFKVPPPPYGLWPRKKRRVIIFL